ncbi:MAG TPA: sigma-54 dependent transcriptional regulator [Candidatus Udaeobacter sp.]|nr:sigma-54 dependent transcriptional regulator [Candidatus Udaeobacter sp.]
MKNSDFGSRSGSGIPLTSPARQVDKSTTWFAPHVLVVDDDDLICHELERCLVESGYAVSICTRATDALEALEKEPVDIVVTDVRLPGMNGVELTRRITESWGDIPIIVITGFGEIDVAVEVLKLGASDFIRKPFTADALQESIKVVLEQRGIFSDLRYLRNNLKARSEFGGMLSRTAEMHKVFETIRMVAETDTTVVIEGETGTGKDLVARAIHDQSARREGPFVTINCAGLPETLLESELFGYERGAFTGADRAKAGKIELAHGGTLFLDEIESMPLTMQAKLLLVLESQKVQRLGSNRSAQIDMRVVAASNIPLRELRNKGLMRTDFYYRLNVILIPLLPLRKRIEDIPLLVQDFLRHYPTAIRKNITKIAPEAMNRLMKYHWPGNIRELQNIMEKAVVLSRSRVIEYVELPEASLDAEVSGEVTSTELPSAEQAPLTEWVKDQEREYLIRRLKAFGGRIGPTAQSCGVDVRTIHRKMRLYGLDKKDFSKNAKSSDPKLESISRSIAINRFSR